MRIGGTEQVIKNLVTGINHDIFEVSILCIEGPIGPFGQQLQKQGVSIDCIERAPGFDLKLVCKIRKYIIEKQIDILHCHQYTPWVYGVLSALITNAKVIFTEHGRFYPDSSSWKRKLINPLLCKITDKITSISKSTKQALVEFESIPNRRIEVIYNGIAKLTPNILATKEIKQQLSITDDKIVFGTIARLDPIKNHKMMLKAFRLVKNKIENTVLVIVGDGEERENITSLIAELNLNDDVIMTGYKATPTSYMSLFDIYLLSSLSEGTSMTLLEAMSISKPCVVTDAGGNPEIIVNQQNGLVTPNDDAESFAQAMLVLAKDKRLCESMAITSLQRYLNFFSQEKMNKDFERCYMELF